jgi:hypothetical protein
MLMLEDFLQRSVLQMKSGLAHLGDFSGLRP